MMLNKIVKKFEIPLTRRSLIIVAYAMTTNRAHVYWLHCRLLIEDQVELIDSISIDNEQSSKISYRIDNNKNIEFFDVSKCENRTFTIKIYTKLYGAHYFSLNYDNRKWSIESIKGWNDSGDLGPDYNLSIRPRQGNRNSGFDGRTGIYSHYHYVDLIVTQERIKIKQSKDISFAYHNPLNDMNRSIQTLIYS